MPLLNLSTLGLMGVPHLASIILKPHPELGFLLCLQHVHVQGCSTKEKKRIIFFFHTFFFVKELGIAFFLSKTQKI